MLKAAAGGGGKGMRMVAGPDDLASAFRAARSEALASFGDDAVYAEKFIVRPRHVEIQVLGDEHGNVISLGERECSLQRRHQKVVEEAPSPVLTPELRRAMGAEAVKAAAAVGYVGAGTVEFLLDSSGRFYFLEMNTRLQVEHPVTELVTGIDLVQAQLQIAEGAPLDREWYDVEPRGHAIEVRVYAEDPFHGFTPSPGLITLLRLPEGPGVRNDFGVRTGSRVSIFYDPMLGKLIVWGKDRAEAMRRLGRALDELRVEGIRTTVPLYKALLADADFIAGRLDIDMLDRKLEANELRPRADSVSAAVDGTAAAAAAEPALPIAAIAAAVEHFATASGRTGSADTGGVNGDGERRRGWRERARRDALRSAAWNW
jgi:acetyl-CoA carboxylase biotin carboxylase subunit